jgi:hypothetical protein
MVIPRTAAIILIFVLGLFLFYFTYRFLRKKIGYSDRTSGWMTIVFLSACWFFPAFYFAHSLFIIHEDLDISEYYVYGTAEYDLGGFPQKISNEEGKIAILNKSDSAFILQDIIYSVYASERNNYVSNPKLIFPHDAIYAESLDFMPDENPPANGGLGMNGASGRAIRYWLRPIAAGDY